MKRVTGIGGIFIKSANTEKLRDWYQKHLGIPVEAWGGTAFRWAGPDNPDGHGTTVWNIFEATSNYFNPSQAPFMINYRVDKLHPLLAALREDSFSGQLRRAIAASRGPRSELAAQTGIDDENLDRFFCGEGELDSHVIDRLAAELGLQLVAVTPAGA